MPLMDGAGFGHFHAFGGWSGVWSRPCPLRMERSLAASMPLMDGAGFGLFHAFGGWSGVLAASMSLVDGAEF